MTRHHFDHLAEPPSNVNADESWSGPELFRDAPEKKHTRIRISFKSERQTPDFMIIKETYVNGKIAWADVIYEEHTLKSEISIEGEFETEKMTSIIPIF